MAFNNKICYNSLEMSCLNIRIKADLTAGLAERNEPKRSEGEWSVARLAVSTVPCYVKSQVMSKEKQTHRLFVFSLT
jgi:hypothetical protein